MDSTFGDGSGSYANQVIGSWKIHACRVGLSAEADMNEAKEPRAFFDVTFDGRRQKTVLPGEQFHTDPVLLSAKAGEYLCVEMSFSGKELPCHLESWLPGFLKTDSGWEYTTKVPFASMVGCDRGVKKRLVFLGDSITQGIGTPRNSYRHVAALIAEKLGADTAVWDIALGFGRAHDAASDGAWLSKARHADAAVVCFGVNDLFRIEGGARLKDDLRHITRALKDSGVKVLLQTVPPFDYSGTVRETWLGVNRFILEEMKSETDGVFDTVPVLGGRDGDIARARYGGHPDENGNAAWAEKLYPMVKGLLN